MNDNDFQSEASSEKIPVIEEHVHYDVQRKEIGKVRITKHVREEVVDVDESVTLETANVERVSVNEYVETLPPPVRYEGDVTIVPVLKEVLVKRMLLVEELHITKKKETQHDTRQVTLRREEVNIHRDKKE